TAENARVLLLDGLPARERAVGNSRLRLLREGCHLRVADDARRCERVLRRLVVRRGAGGCDASGDEQGFRHAAVLQRSAATAYPLNPSKLQIGKTLEAIKPLRGRGPVVRAH